MTLSLYAKAFSGDVDLSGEGHSSLGSYIMADIYKYVKDCVEFEMSRQGSRIDINDLYNNSDLLTILGFASNPAVYTMWYSADAKAGETVTCKEAYNRYLYHPPLFIFIITAFLPKSHSPIAWGL